MELYLPLAGVHVAWPLLLGLGLLVGILQGFFGVGGGWLTTPTLNILGLPIVYAIGTDLAFTAGAALVGAFRHFRLGNLDVRLAGLLGLCGMVGLEASRRLVLHLETLGMAETSIRVAYAVLLSTVGVLILRRELQRSPRLKSAEPRVALEPEPLGEWLRRFNPLHAGPTITLADGSPASVAALVGTGLGTGCLAGFLGTGGGFVLVPMLVYGIGLPSRAAVAASLLSISITNSFGTLGYGVAGRVELLAAGLMFAGAFIGTQLGAMATRIAQQHHLQVLLGLTLLTAGVAVVLRQADQYLASAAVMFAAATAMALVILGILVRDRHRPDATLRSARGGRGRS